MEHPTGKPVVPNNMYTVLYIRGQKTTPFRVRMSHGRFLRSPRFAGEAGFAQDFRRTLRRSRSAVFRSGKPWASAAELHSVTSIPILLAVPSIILIALSTSSALRSFALVCAISLICAFVTFPIFSLFGWPEALATPQARFKSTEHGGLFIINEKDLSSYTLMITGSTRPCLSFVFSLKDLQNSIIFTPCWPKEGPTGGAGFACPPVTCNLIIDFTFLAMIYLGF